MGTPADTGPKVTWTHLIIGVIVLAAAGWLAWSNVPRPVRADLGMVPVVDEFDYASWDTEIQLSRDGHGRPVVHVTETVVARFPDHDQNKGIVRGIPTRYSSDVQQLTVTDEAGDSVPYDREFDADHDMLYVLIGTDDYVHGEQTYVISYRTSTGVVRDPRNDVQELYWNLLPLDSAQEIEQFSATIRIDPELTGALTGRHACYQGRYGSTDTCELRTSTGRDGTVHTYASGHRAAGDGVTVAVGLADGTFTGVPSTNVMAPPPLWRTLYENGTLGAAAAGVGLLAVWGGRILHRRFTARMVAADPRASTLPPMPRSGVPATLPPPVAAALLRADRVQRGKEPRESKALAGRAEIVHLGVQGAIRFEGDPSRGRMSVRLLDRELARHPIDQRMLDVLFPAGAAQDTVRQIPRKDARFAKAVQAMDRHGRRAAGAQGLLRLWSHPVAVIGCGLGVLLAAAGAVSVLIAPGTGRAFALLVSVAAAVFGIMKSVDVLRPEPMLTERGWAARDQLRAVRLHLRRTLRRERAGTTPGAEAVSDDGVDALQVYERLLPYAMLFRLAGKWSRLLATRYDEERTPVWLVGSGTAFLGHWQYVNGTVRKSGTYVPPSTSASGGGGFSGGSSGGGFSGGGGGGGFSGGR